MRHTTDPQNELLTEVTAQNEVIGPIPRNEAHTDNNKIYRQTYIIVKDVKGRVLIQKRSATKDLYPNCWDLSVGGHVPFGLNYEETAVKELKEELGISTTKDDLTFMGEVLVDLPSSKEFFHVFEYTLKPTDTIHPMSEEVADVQWMPIEKIQKSMKDQTMTWYPRPIQVVEKIYTNSMGNH